MPAGALRTASRGATGSAEGLNERGPQAASVGRGLQRVGGQRLGDTVVTMAAPRLEGATPGCRSGARLALRAAQNPRGAGRERAAPAHGSLGRSTGRPRPAPFRAVGERRRPQGLAGAETRVLAALPGREPGRRRPRPGAAGCGEGPGLFDAAEGSGGGRHAAIFGPVRRQRRLW